MTAFTTPATFSAAAVLTAAQMNTNVRDNVNHLFEQIHSGSSTPGWTTFTPSWTNLTTTSGTNSGRKGYAGKTTFFEVEFTFGASSAITGAVSLAFPEASYAYTQNHPVGMAAYLDAGTNAFEGLGVWNTGGVILLYTKTVSGSNIIFTNLSSTVPFTWTTNDKIFIHGFYERT